MVTRPHRRFRLALYFILIISPVVVLAFLSFARLRHELNESAFARRRAVAHFASGVLKERLDRLVDIGVSLATRPIFAERASEGKWAEAMELLSDVPKDFPFITQIFVTDTEGTLKSGLPEQADLVDKNFAFRDWYKGCSRGWKPYISEVYKTMYKPLYNAVAVAVPIRVKDGRPFGILAFLLPLDTLRNWVKEFEFGPPGFIYIVNHKGQLVAHPGFSPQGGIIDFSGVPVVRQILEGRSGLSITYNPVEKEERLSAYEGVPGYGWGVVVQEPAAAAFKVRDETLRIFLLIYGIVILLSVSITSVILYYSDLRRRTEEMLRVVNLELNRRNTELASLNKELEAFSYSVSHDLRAPLRSMDGFGKILLEEHGGELDAEGKDCLRRICAAAQRMAELIDDLLDLSRVSRTELHFEAVDLSVLAREIRRELQKTQPERQAEFVIAPGLVVQGDRRLLRIMLENLLSNAWKFTGKQAGGKIEVGKTEREGQTVFFVRDNGVGFDMAYADKLFGAFQRLHSQSEFPGTGIGLVTAQRIIHKHGGRVWAEAQVNKGATFYFVFNGRH